MKNLFSFVCVCAALLVAACGGNVEGYSPDVQPTLPDTFETPPAATSVATPPATTGPQQLNTNPPRPPVVAYVDFAHDFGIDGIAVPKNAMSEEIEVFATDAGSKNVAASWVWEVNDVNVAQLVPGSDGSKQRFTTALDAFDSPDRTTEPTTFVTVCAETVSNAEPVCNATQIFAVANLAGAWNFYGYPFGDPNESTTLTIEQVGRQLTIDGTGQGTVYGLDVQFYYGNFNYTGTIVAPGVIEGEFTLAGSDSDDPINWWWSEQQTTALSQLVEMHAMVQLHAQQL
ncbi:MAG: hypothetical protein PHS79_04790 [Patescibacteria group bacterium]|nr:hypothetical protein [Patescibacteria group bacterium]